MLAVICDDRAADREILLGFCARYAKEKHLPIATLEFENAGALLNSREARRNENGSDFFRVSHMGY